MPSLIRLCLSLSALSPAVFSVPIVSIITVHDETREDYNTAFTVKILCIGTDRAQQTVQTKIRLLLKKQSDQGLRCLHCISFF